ncbi:ABC transporter substrate-binding protein [Bhargavaea ullalensis]
MGKASEGKNGKGNREIVVATVTEPDSVDVHKTSSISDPTAAAYLSFLNMDDQGSTIPGAIKDYEVSDDGKEIIFSLEEGLTFHSGEPFNADALKSSMDRFLETSPFYDNAGEITDIEVMDDYTIKFTWAEPYAPFFSNAVSPYLAPLDTSVLDGNGEGFEKNPSALGPLKITDIKRGDSITYEPFEDYKWPDGKPNFDKVKFRFVPDEETRALEFKKGTVNILMNVPGQYVGELEKDPEVNIEKVPDYVLNYLGWNNKLPKFQDERVRKAIALAIDRAPIVDTALEGFARPVYGPLPEATFGYSEEIEEKAKEIYARDTEKAKSLLEEAGWTINSKGLAEKDGEEFSVELWVDTDPVNHRIAQILQNQLMEIGIKMNISTQESAAIIEQTPQGKHEMILWAYGWLDADVMYFLLFGEGRSTRLHYEDPELNRILKEARVEMDVDKRLALYKEAQEFVMKETPFVPLYVKETIHATRGLDSFKAHPIRNYIEWEHVKASENN